PRPSAVSVRRGLRRPAVAPLSPYTTVFRSRLLELGVPREGIAVTADAAFALAPPGAAAREAARNRLGPADRRLIGVVWRSPWVEDRKSTRLNSSHVKNSYAVFRLKNKTYAA